MIDGHTEAFVSELRHTLRQEAREREFKKLCPECAICGEKITDERCIVMDDYYAFDTAIHKECYAREYRKIVRAKVHPVIADWITDEVEYGKDVYTPRRSE